MQRLPFTLLWTVAQAWPAAVGTVWPIVYVGDTSWELDVQVRLIQFSIFLAALTQWPLLLKRVSYPWLWLVAGLVFSLFYIFLDLVLRNTTYGASLMKGGAFESYAFMFGCGSIGIGVCQAAVMGIWRKGGLSWLVIVTVAFLIANVGCVYASFYRSYIPFWFGWSWDGWDDFLAIRTIQYGFPSILFGVMTGWLIWPRLFRVSPQPGPA